MTSRQKRNEELREIGRKLKQEHPEWTGYTDLTVGRLALKNGLSITEPTQELIPAAAKPEVKPYQLSDELQKVLDKTGDKQWGLGAWWEKHGEKQRVELSALETQNGSNKVQLAAQINQAVITEQQRKYIPETIRQEHDVNTVVNVGLIQDQLIHNQLAEQAAKVGLDAPSHVEVNKIRNIEKIKVEMLKEQDENRLTAYAREWEIDIQGILKQKTGGHHVVYALEQYYQRLLKDRSLLEKDTELTAEMKQKALDAKDHLIEQARKDLDEQIQRHLLTAGDGKDLGAAKEADDSPSGS